MSFILLCILLGVDLFLTSRASPISPEITEVEQMTGAPQQVYQVSHHLGMPSFCKEREICAEYLGVQYCYRQRKKRNIRCMNLDKKREEETLAFRVKNRKLIAKKRPLRNWIAACWTAKNCWRFESMVEVENDVSSKVKRTINE